MIPTVPLTSNPTSVMTSTGDVRLKGENPAPKTAIPISIPTFPRTNIASPYRLDPTQTVATGRFA